MESSEFSPDRLIEAAEAEANVLAEITPEVFDSVIECETLKLIREGLSPEQAAELTSDLQEVKFEVLGGSEDRPVTYIAKIAKHGSDEYVYSLERGDREDFLSQVTVGIGEDGAYRCTGKFIRNFNVSQMFDALALGRKQYAWLISELEKESSTS